MNTPKRGASQAVHTVSTEEKEQMLENLDIEVANNRRKIEAYLEQILEAFTVRHEWEITRIPKNVRKLTLKQFMAYGGTVQTCAQALAKQRVEENEESGLARKRKWQAAIQEAHEEERPAKNARIAPPSPVKQATRLPSRSAFPKTPTKSTSRMGPSSARKQFHPHEDATSKSRPTSPVKPSSFKPPTTTFNPSIPKTPTFPRRVVRKNEAVLSINGTPLVLPAGTGTSRGNELSKVDEDEDEVRVVKLVRGSNGIVVRRDPSYNPSHSLASTTTAVSTNSIGPTITVPTHRGQLLQFDPVAISPSSLDRLPGITDSAKKQAKEEMIKIVNGLRKWHL